MHPSGSPRSRVATLLIEWGPFHKALKAGRITRPLPLNEVDDEFCAGDELYRFLWETAKQGAVNGELPVFACDRDWCRAVERDAMVRYIRGSIDKCLPDGTFGDVDLKRYGTHSARSFFVTTAFNRKISKDVAIQYAQFAKNSKIAQELYHKHSISYWKELDNMYSPRDDEDIVLAQ